ncbi:hypothetical protein DFH11DRAFT_1219359 [Phellopilus nigrolimitatus]|nr:hypothetical protein DFH11DRAFT_1219359 [Phellopilus nigrolimitatus]
MGPNRHLRAQVCSLSITITGRMFNDEHTMSTSEIFAMTESDQASLCSASTNATDDNLPGAGRTLGLLYSFAGRHLEVQLGRLAERLGRGPRATALRIQKNNGIVTRTSALPLPLSVVKYRTKKIEKDCKRLLRYVGSNALSTRGQALDHIIDLSFDDHVRDLLKLMGAARLIGLAHKELFVRRDYDASLLSRSRKALISVTDDMLMQDIKELNERHKSMFFFRGASHIWAYVRDPDRSHIVIRWLVRLGRLVFLFPSMPILNYLNVVVGTSPEWESIDQLLSSFIGLFKTRSMHFFDPIATTLEIIARR